MYVYIRGHYEGGRESQNKERDTHRRWASLSRPAKKPEREGEVSERVAYRNVHIAVMRILRSSFPPLTLWVLGDRWVGSERKIRGPGVCLAGPQRVDKCMCIHVKLME